LIVVLALISFQLTSEERGHRSDALPHCEVDKLTQHNHSEPRQEFHVADLHHLELPAAEDAIDPTQGRGTEGESVSVCVESRRRYALNADDCASH
jgi:hypothetical protein